MTIVFFFFFQAEDGIRDGHVTGVQTCALPIFEGGEAVVTVQSLEAEHGLIEGRRAAEIGDVERRLEHTGDRGHLSRRSSARRAAPSPPFRRASRARRLATPAPRRRAGMPDTPSSRSSSGARSRTAPARNAPTP